MAQSHAQVNCITCHFHLLRTIEYHKACPGSRGAIVVVLVCGLASNPFKPNLQTCLICPSVRPSASRRSRRILSECSQRKASKLDF